MSDERNSDAKPEHAHSRDARCRLGSRGAHGAGVSGHVIEHTGDPAHYLHECLRVLAPGGVLSLEFPSRYHHTELDTQLPSFEWLPRPLRNGALRLASSRLAPITAQARISFSSILGTNLQQISMGLVRRWARRSGYPHTILDVTKPVPGIIRCVIRKDRKQRAEASAGAERR